MPIYEYRCQSCGHELEKLQRMSDPVLTDCPDCSQPELKRLVSAAGFRLKGSGWYETDFKKGGKKNLHDSGDSGSKASGPDSSGAESTTQSDTKSTSKGTSEATGQKTDVA